jgi:hypothetical protein
VFKKLVDIERHYNVKINIDKQPIMREFRRIEALPIKISNKELKVNHIKYLGSILTRYTYFSRKSLFTNKVKL